MMSLKLEFYATTVRLRTTLELNQPVKLAAWRPRSSFVQTACCSHSMPPTVSFRRSSTPTTNDTTRERLLSQLRQLRQAIDANAGPHAAAPPKLAVSPARLRAIAAFAETQKRQADVDDASTSTMIQAAVRGDSSRKASVALQQRAAAGEWQPPPYPVSVASHGPLEPTTRSICKPLSRHDSGEGASEAWGAAPGVRRSVSFNEESDPFKKDTHSISFEDIQTSANEGQPRTATDAYPICESPRGASAPRSGARASLSPIPPPPPSTRPGHAAEHTWRPKPPRPKCKPLYPRTSPSWADFAIDVDKKAEELPPQQGSLSHRNQGRLERWAKRSSLEGRKRRMRMRMRCCCLPTIAIGVLGLVLVAIQWQSFVAFAVGGTTNVILPRVQLAEEPPPTFVTPAKETPPFLGCGYCAPCLECRDCYDGRSTVYDRRFDRCPHDQGPCGTPHGRLSFCARECTPYVALGPERLACLNSTRQFCAYRDPALELADPGGGRASGGRDGGGPPTTTGDGDDDDDDDDDLTGAGRWLAPTIHLPDGYEEAAAHGAAGRSWPLLVQLSGRFECANVGYYGFGLRALAASQGFVYMAPESAGPSRIFCTPKDVLTDPQCAGTDDVAYVWSLVEAVRRRHRVGDVYFFGFSNGASMALTMACYHADAISGVVAVGAVLPFGWLASHDDAWGGAARGSTVEQAGPLSKALHLDLTDAKLPNASLSRHPTYRHGCPATAAVPTLVVKAMSDPIVSFEPMYADVATRARLNGCALASCAAPRRTLDLLPRASGVSRLLNDAVLGLFHGGRAKLRPWRLDASGWTDLWPGWTEERTLLGTRELWDRFNESIAYAFDGCPRGGEAELWLVDALLVSDVHESGILGAPGQSARTFFSSQEKELQQHLEEEEVVEEEEEEVEEEPQSRRERRRARFEDEFASFVYGYHGMGWSKTTDLGENFAMPQQALRWLLDHPKVPGPRADARGGGAPPLPGNATPLARAQAEASSLAARCKPVGTDQFVRDGLVLAAVAILLFAAAPVAIGCCCWAQLLLLVIDLIGMGRELLENVGDRLSGRHSRSFVRLQESESGDGDGGGGDVGGRRGGGPPTMRSHRSMPAMASLTRSSSSYLQMADRLRRMEHELWQARHDLLESAKRRQVVLPSVWGLSGLATDRLAGLRRNHSGLALQRAEQGDIGVGVYRGGGARREGSVRMRSISSPDLLSAKDDSLALHPLLPRALLE